MDDILSVLSADLNSVERRLRGLREAVNRGEADKTQEVFQSVVLHQPFEKTEEDASEFNLATIDGVKNMLKRATKNKVFFKKVQRCVFQPNR